MVWQCTSVIKHTRVLVLMFHVIIKGVAAVALVDKDCCRCMIVMFETKVADAYL